MPAKVTATAWGQNFKNAWIIVPVVLIGTWLLALAGCMSRVEPRLPSDAELIDLFKKNKADFDVLVSMLKVDKQLEAIQQDGSYDKNAITSERASKYHTLLKRCGLTGQVVFSHVGQDSQVADICLWRWNGRSLSNAKGIMKGYIYSTKKLGSSNNSSQVSEAEWPWEVPGLLKDTLDGNDFGKLGPRQSWYRPIEGNWYLYVLNLNHDSND